MNTCDIQLFHLIFFLNICEHKLVQKFDLAARQFVNDTKCPVDNSYPEYLTEPAEGKHFEIMQYPCFHLHRRIPLSFNNPQNTVVISSLMLLLYVLRFLILSKEWSLIYSNLTRHLDISQFLTNMTWFPVVFSTNIVMASTLTRFFPCCPDYMSLSVLQHWHLISHFYGNSFM